MNSIHLLEIFAMCCGFVILTLLIIQTVILGIIKKKKVAFDRLRDTYLGWSEIAGDEGRTDLVLTRSGQLLRSAIKYRRAVSAADRRSALGEIIEMARLLERDLEV